MWCELSAGIGGTVFLALLDLADHPVQAGEDLLVHLRDPGLALAAGGVDQGERAVALLPQPGQELRPGDEDRAGQALLTELTDVSAAQEAQPSRSQSSGCPEDPDHQAVAALSPA